MHIRCAAANGIQQHLIHILDDGRVIYLGGDGLFVFLIAAFSLHSFQTGVFQVAHGGILAFQVLVDGGAELGVIYQNRVCAQAGVELDLVQRLQVGRV